jgi:predicted RNase H-like HicB family nuclease
MRAIKYLHCEEGDAWVGWLEDYPNYRTQGYSMEKLEEHVKDIVEELSGGSIPGVQPFGKPLVQ